MAGTIGDTLKKLREAKGLSMAFVAKQLDLSLGAYQKYENNTRDVSTSTLNAIADFYNITTDYLLGRPDAKPPADPIDEFADKVKMQEQEQIILKKWLALDEKRRQAVFDFMVDIVREYDRCMTINDNSEPEIGITYSKIYADEGGVTKKETPAGLPKISDFFDD